MGKASLNILIGNVRNNLIPSIHDANDRYHAYYEAKYGKKSMFSLIKELPNFLLPKTFEPTDPNPTDSIARLYKSHTIATNPCMTEAAKNKFPGKPAEVIIEEKRRMIKVESEQFDQLYKDVLPQQELLDKIVKEYEVQGKGLPKAQYIISEIKKMLDPENTWVRSALTHNQVLDLRNPNLLQTIKECVKEDLNLASKSPVEWNQKSQMKEFFESLNKLGMAAEMLTDRIESEAVVQSESAQKEVFEAWQIVSDPTNKLTNIENVANHKHGDRTYNLYNRKEYLDYVEAIQFNKREDSKAPVEVIIYDAQESNKVNTK
ncbi:MAG: hypothetical protein J6X00_03785 [Clostridia bacterium]|nr:hypothetical protein [Clostridia bacterium]